MAEQMIQVQNPLVIIEREADGNLKTIILDHPGMDHRAFGLVVCDLVRNVARAFKVSEDDVWEWVWRERLFPTTDITVPS